MSKLEHIILITFSFIIFLLVYVRLSFFVGFPIEKNTLPTVFVLYILIALFFYSFGITSIKNQFIKFVPVFSFIGLICAMSFGAVLLANTHDTSWDGQGYHQTAVIALANGWNPVYEPYISLPQRLPSQIFSEGYPSALWEIQASIYALTGKINSAKITNIFLAFLAFLVLYSLMRILKFSLSISMVTSLLVVISPVYLLQLLTFMQDGAGYQILIIAVSSLAIFGISSKKYWSIPVCFFSVVMLASTKYSHLPLALVLGGLFVVVFFNRILNKEYKFLNYKLVFVTITFLVLFAYLPYVRNVIYHKAPFYPTNIPDLMGSVKYNNIPINLASESKHKLFFYGVFSRAQSSESGDPIDPSNIAELKMPFTFSLTEVDDSVSLHNNRVGAGGPLFSGIVLLSVLLVVIAYFKMHTRNERYAVYVSTFSLLLIVLLALMTPTPNLLRYVNQVQLIPYAAMLPIMYAFKERIYVKTFTYSLLLLSLINIGLFTNSLINKTVSDYNSLNEQYKSMRDSKKEYQVTAQHFYSNYLMLVEQNINFTAVDRLKCAELNYLSASSTTTMYCEK